MDKREKLNRKIRVGTNICIMLSAQEMPWFLCFGTLLHFIRDRKLNLEQDIDIDVIGSIHGQLYDTIDNSYRIDHIVRNDHNGDILNLAFYDSFNKIYIDLFRWVKFRGMYWHTYDQDHERPEDGVLKSYTWRSMPREVFQCPKIDRKKYIEDLRYGNMSPRGTWLKSLPDAPAEGVNFCLPYMYGYFLDVAYTEWHTVREQFGQSEGYTKITVNSCKGLY